MLARTACPQDHVLRDFVLRRHAPEEIELLAQHLDECDRCAGIVDQLLAGDAALAWPDPNQDCFSAAERDQIGALIARLQEVILVGPPSGIGPRQDDENSEHPGTQAENCDFLAPPQAAGELGRLGRYRVLALLGAGGMGVVFHAEDPSLRRHVALKAMKPALAASASARRRFLREARAAAALKHDHVVTIFNVGEDRGLPYLAMELLQGESLATRLQNVRGPLPLAEMLQIGREVALALAAAHARGLIHRDVKPGNIWLKYETKPDNHDGVGRACRPSFTVKLLDFGLVRHIKDGSAFTQPGAALGTPGYMAPEQAAGATVDHRADLFSLGCVLYLLATGTPAFDDKPENATRRSTRGGSPRLPLEVNPNLPVAVSTLIQRLLCPMPHDRPQSAEDVLTELERITNGDTDGLATRQPAHRQRFSLVWAAAAVFSLALIAALAVFFSFPGSARQPTAHEAPPRVTPTLAEPGEQGAARQSLARKETSEPGVSRESPKTKEEDLGTKKEDAKQPPTPTSPWVSAWRAELAREGVTMPPLPAASSPLDQLRAVDIAPQAREELPPDAVVLLDEPVGSVSRCAFTPDGNRLVTGKSDGTISFWRLTTSPPRHIIYLTPKQIKGSITQMVISNNGKWMATVNSMPDVSTLTLWEMNADGADARGALQLPRIDDIAFHPNSQMLVVGDGKENKARLYGISAKGFQLQSSEFRGAQKGHAFSPGGGLFASICFAKEHNGELSESEIMFWQIAGSDIIELTKIRQDHSFHTMAVSPDGTLLVTADSGNTVRFWDLEAVPPPLLAEFPMSGWVKSVHYTPDGRHVVAFATMQEIMLLNVRKGSVAKEWHHNPKSNAAIAKGPTTTFSATAMAPDGRHVAFSTETPKVVILRLPINPAAKAETEPGPGK